jgi:hypothetical protein
MLNYQLAVGNTQAQTVAVRVFDENDNVVVKQFPVQ